MSQSKMPGWVIPTVILGVLVVTVMMIVFSGIGVKNDAVELRNQFNAQVEANKVIYDEVTKVIFGQAKVAETERESFGNIYTELMSSRAEGTENAMMAWVKEQNPTISNELYVQLSQTIEAQRAKFSRVQQKQVDIKREHDNLRLKFPSSIFMNFFGETELELKLVTSSRVERSFETGIDDNADPFSNE
jgi:spore coat protein CotF